MQGASSEIVLTSVFMALEGAFAYSAFLPSIMTIGTFVDSPDKVKMIRQGEVVGTVFLLGLAFIVSGITKSGLPLIFAVGAGAITLGVYEFALKSAPVNVGEEY